MPIIAIPRRVDSSKFVVKNDNMGKARKLLHTKYLRDNGMIVEILVWQLSSATPDYPNGLKYRLYYGDRRGNCKVLYDIHKGKRAHKHIDGIESDYTFIDIDTLIKDFKADMEENP